MRFRFAPSPTGDLHFGNARTAIINWIMAKKSDKNSFILRIEDTDVERNTQSSEAGIYRAMKWLGLDYDEGPNNPGNFGPYRQSETLEMYKQYTAKLVESGDAYECFCTSEELEKRREESEAKKVPFSYDRRCLRLDKTEKDGLKRKGVQFSVRFKVPEKAIKFNDKIKGEVEFLSSTIGDFVIMRSSDIPTYNFAVVIDDIRMDIDTVIRGDDHLANTPKQILIYEAISRIDKNIKIPNFAHIPMILGPDRSKLSKRHGAVSVNRAIEEGYLPDALVNYLSLLGWSSEDGEELLSRDDLIKKVEFERMSSSASVFDFEKFRWINQQYLKKLSDKEFIDFVMPHLLLSGWNLPDNGTVEKIILTVREAVQYGAEIKKWTEIFFSEKNIEDFGDEQKDVLAWESSIGVIKEFRKLISEANGFSLETVSEAIKGVQNNLKVKGKQLFMPIRVASTGEVHGPDLKESIFLMGKNKVVAMIDKVITHFDR